MAVETIQLDSWAEFKNILTAYSALDQSRKGQLVFRGHTDSTWDLKATIDRLREFSSNEERKAFLNRLLGEFKRCAAGLGATLPPSTQDLSWELLARHYGLATTVLDWTQSPWIAAYFAFEDTISLSAECVAIWCLDREIFATKAIPEIEIVDDESLLSENVRAIEQGGLFMQIRQIEQNAVDYLEPNIYKWEIPSRDGRIALKELDDMGINRRNLFRDLESAALTAARRVIG